MERRMAAKIPSVTLEHEINPWEAQTARFEFAARKLNLDPGLWKMLSTPVREIIVHFPVTMDSGKVEKFTVPGVDRIVTITEGTGK